MMRLGDVSDNRAKRGRVLRASPLPSLLASAVLLTACDRIPGTDAYVIKRVEAYLSSFANDPKGVQFRNVEVHKGGVVCGEYNEKNLFGSYVGNIRFVAEPPAGADDTDMKSWHITTDSHVDDAQAEYSSRMCKTMSADRYMAASAPIVCKAAAQQAQNKIEHEFLESMWKANCT